MKSRGRRVEKRNAEREKKNILKRSAINIERKKKGLPPLKEKGSGK